LVQSQMRERHLPVYAISAATGQGTTELLRAVHQVLQVTPREPAAIAEAKVFRPTDDEEAFEIVKEDDSFRVRGKRIERAAVMTDWTNSEAVARFQRIIKAMGIQEALQEAGVQPGDTVFIGDYELEWQW
jgi:GTP-binding protein